MYHPALSLENLKRELREATDLLNRVFIESSETLRESARVPEPQGFSRG